MLLKLAEMKKSVLGTLHSEAKKTSKFLFFNTSYFATLNIFFFRREAEEKEKKEKEQLEALQKEKQVKMSFHVG